LDAAKHQEGFRPAVDPVFLLVELVLLLNVKV
jgi:hypothetical protein